MIIKKKEILLITGTISLIIMLILRLINSELGILNFFEGLFTGFSITANLAYLVKYSKEKSIMNKLEM
jgi:hypothetical protein